MFSTPILFKLIHKGWIEDLQVKSHDFPLHQDTLSEVELISSKSL